MEKTEIVMDYEKKYNEALERAQKVTRAGGDVAKEIVQYIFPELCESEDERIRKGLIEALKTSKTVGELKFILPEPTREECLAYLEKQKEKSRNITANLLEDGITGIQRELIEFLANNIDASWVDVIKSADAYAQRIRSMVEKQKEQKPEDRFKEAREKYQVEWSEEDERIRKSLIEIVERFMDGERKEKTLAFLEKQKEQKQEWSEEDEEKLKAICTYLRDYSRLAKLDDKLRFNEYCDFLESLRPSWKPSEEQMEALKCAVEDVAKFSKRGGRQVELENEPYYSALHSLYCNLEKLM